MTDRGQRSEWLSLIDVSGPFLAEPVLKGAFPQGLEGLEPSKKKTLRQSYDEWREALDLDDRQLSKIHRAWVDLVLRQGLELDEDGKGDVLKADKNLPGSLKCELPEHGVTLRPDYAVVDGKPDGAPRMLVSIYDPDVALSEVLKHDGWAASPAERMVELCRGTGVRLGLVTNGERWMFVDAPVGKVTSFASWYARHWGQEPVTLQAFVNLLGIRRFFVDSTEQLPALLDKSLEHQDEVTDALGEQVRRAVEVLIQALDRADVDRDRELLKGVEAAELYEAGLTVMMRIVFLLSAEERGLLLMGDPRYEGNYAVSTLRMQLRSESEEILERRWDAWSRLLSIFRAVYGGIDHEAMRLPALGGSLFDPDRFPFFEGRAKGSTWKTDPATPLPIDNRTVLLLLDAVQLFQGRTLSYLALDVEQIGYVYEGLLERTATRATQVTLDLDATKNSDNPWVSLPNLDDAAVKGREALEKLLEEHTGSSGSRVRNDLDREVDELSADKLLTACHGDRTLRDRLRPYFHLLRTDPWGYPLVYPKDTFMVTMGTDRRETGTHYTPKSLTEAIVKDTLEPVVYVGPTAGKPRETWKLKSTTELFDLKVCDPAMGSGAFLVQVCRWLSERVVEAWTEAERQGKTISSQGEVLAAIGSREPLHTDPQERLLTARRLVAERCLYGVDMNPLAVELAKLSIWLITLSKGRPFGFLDHNLRSGDSLLGITNLDQLHYLDMKPGKGSSKRLFASDIDKAVANAIALRSALRQRPIQDIRDVEAMSSLDQKARHSLRLPGLAADALIGALLVNGGNDSALALTAVTVGEAIAGDSDKTALLCQAAQEALSADLPARKTVRHPFHWPLAFPEVFSRHNGGFDAFVGNPPFLGGQLISGSFGTSYHAYLVEFVTYDDKSSVDLVVYFFLRVFLLLRQSGAMGLLARRSISEGKNRQAGLSQLLAFGAQLYSARTNMLWPGKASVVVHQIHVYKGTWAGIRYLNRLPVPTIASNLSDTAAQEARSLQENAGRAFQGSILLGEGFKVDEATARQWIKSDGKYRKVLRPFIGGHEINQSATAVPRCWVINFWDWPLSTADRYDLAIAVVRSKVKPRRDKNKRKARRERWWLYGETAAGLYRALGNVHEFAATRQRRGPARTLTRVLAISTGVTKYPAFTFLDPHSTYSHKLCVLADDRFSMFATLSSDIHGVWSWVQKTSLGGDLYSLVYAHGNIFGTFPFPESFLSNGDETLEELGRQFFTQRQSYMEERGLGLTGFYNEFHDRSFEDSSIVRLRSLQQDINRRVVQRYGWIHIKLDMGFRDVGYLPEGANTRFTIDESARRELLALLFELNRRRAENEPNVSGTRPDSNICDMEVEEDETFEEGLFASEKSKSGCAHG